MLLQKGFDHFVFFIILNLRMPSNLFAMEKKKMWWFASCYLVVLVIVVSISTRFSIWRIFSVTTFSIMSIKYRVDLTLKFHGGKKFLYSYCYCTIVFLQIEMPILICTSEAILEMQLFLGCLTPFVKEHSYL